jgi:hypothetical protein
MNQATRIPGKQETRVGRRGFGRWIWNQKGMALITVLIFGFVFIIGTMAFFAVAGYEAAQAQIRNDSLRAFYLADGAIERAKVQLLKNIRWADNGGHFAITNLDGGQFALSVSDTFYQGATRKLFYAEGTYRRTKRDVAVIANVVPAGQGLAIHASNDIHLQGNICLDGYAHANGDIENGSHFRCGGDPIYTYDSGYPVNPPVIYTEPDSFPDLTYYYVTATDGPGTADTLWLKDRNKAPINFWIDPAGPPNITWKYFQNTKTLSFDAQPTNVYDQATGLFPRLGSDVSVIINFGGSPSPADHQKTDLNFHETGSPPYEIQTSFINTRFIGSTQGDRLLRNKWEGGATTTQTKAVFAPLACIAVIGQTISGNATVQMGTAAHPALTYIMDNVDFSVGGWTVTGTLISLGDITIGGGVNLNYNAGFISCLPPSLRDNWPNGTSGAMEVLLWREPPTRS